MHQRMFRTHRRGRRPRRPFRRTIVGVSWLQTLGVADFAHDTKGAHAFVHNPAYPIPLAQPAHLFYGRTNVIRSPTPGGRGSPPIRGASHPRRSNPSVTALWAATAPLSGEPRGGVQRTHVIRSPTSPPTPQSRPFGPCQLPFQGSRVGGMRRNHVIRSSPTPSSTHHSRPAAACSLTAGCTLDWFSASSNLSPSMTTARTDAMSMASPE